MGPERDLPTLTATGNVARIETAKTDPSVADVAAVNQRMVQRETGFGAYNFYGDNKFVGPLPAGRFHPWTLRGGTGYADLRRPSSQQRMIFLLEVPIITNGRFDGVVYGGISADFLSDIVINLSIGSDGVAYVLDNKGNVIGHREASIVEEGSNMIEAIFSSRATQD